MIIHLPFSNRMKKQFLSLLLILFLPAGCASISSAPIEKASIRLQANPPQLQFVAQQSLRNRGIGIDNDNPDLPLLTLSESNSESIESLAADGSIGGYDVFYTLHYQLGDGEAKRIQREEVVEHNENLYRASIQQRQQMVNSLRRSALAQMLALLNLH